MKLRDVHAEQRRAERIRPSNCRMRLWRDGRVCRVGMSREDAQCGRRTSVRGAPRQTNIPNNGAEWICGVRARGELQARRFRMGEQGVVGVVIFSAALRGAQY